MSIKESEVITAPTGLKYFHTKITDFKADKSIPYVLTGDYSSIDDSTVITLAHSQVLTTEQKQHLDLDIDKEFKYTIVDAIVRFIPDKIKRIYVSHISIQEFIDYVLSNLNIVAASLDRLESSLTLEKFNTSAIKADKHDVNNTDYARLRNTASAGLLRIPYHQVLDFEFHNVQWYPSRNRVDHTPSGSKDVLDTVCQADRLLRTVSTQSVTMSVLDVSSQQEEKKQDINDWSFMLNQFMP